MHTVFVGDSFDEFTSRMSIHGSHLRSVRKDIEFSIFGPRHTYVSRNEDDCEGGTTSDAPDSLGLDVLPSHAKP